MGGGGGGAEFHHGKNSRQHVREKAGKTKVKTITFLGGKEKPWCSTTNEHKKTPKSHGA